MKWQCCLSINASIPSSRTHTHSQGKKRLSEREVVISANYNDYISFLKNAIWNFYEHWSDSFWFYRSFSISLTFSFLCWWMAFHLKYGLRFTVRNVSISLGKIAFVCVCKREKNRVLRDEQMPITHRLVALFKMKMMKMRFINTWCIRNIQLEIWNQHKPKTRIIIHTWMENDRRRRLYTNRVLRIQTSNHQFSHSHIQIHIHIYKHKHNYSFTTFTVYTHDHLALASP